MNQAYRLWMKYQHLRRSAQACLAHGAEGISDWLDGRTSPRALFLVLLVASLCVRLWGLGLAPLEFHPARQFMGANIARHLFLSDRAEEPGWRRNMAERNRLNEKALEPQILEYAASWSYRLAGRELLWIPRAMSVASWLLGAVFLYCIGVRLFSPPSALVSVLFYLFMPFGIMASRSFQPDPLMICLQLAGVLALMHFAEKECMGRLVLAAAICAVAVFVKPVCLFVLLGVYGVGALRRNGVLHTLKSRHTYMLGAILLLPVTYYVWAMLPGAGGSDLGSQAAGSIIPKLLLTRVFWCGLAVMLGRVIGFVPLLLALLGLAFVTERRYHQGTLAGMWLGYLLFVLVFTYHTHTHDYYHLQVLPIAALSLGPLAMVVLGYGKGAAWLTRVRLGLAIALVLGLGGLVVGGTLYWRHAHGRVPSHMKSAIKTVGAVFGMPQKFLGFLRPRSIQLDEKVTAARAAGEAVGHSLHTVHLGSDGGHALVYLGEFSGMTWPSAGLLRSWRVLGDDPPSADQRLQEFWGRDPDLEYFVVTDLGDLAQQADLAELLTQYPVASRGPGYTVYSLRR